MPRDADPGGAAPTREERIRVASAERRERARSDLRGRILAAGTALFDTGGSESVTMRAVAERIGYSPTTIYLHFADRDALLFAIVDEALVAFGAAMTDAIGSTDDARGRIAAMGRAYVGFALDHPAHYRLMFVQRPDYLLAHGPAEEQARIASLGALMEIAADTHAGSSGRLDPAAAADAMWAAMHGIAALATGVAIFDRARALAATEAALAMLQRGLET